MFDKDGGKAWARRMRALGATFEPGRAGASDATAIRRWMRAHADEHVDPRTGELDSTGIVEAWDRACADGGATLDMDHVAWEIAAALATSLHDASRRNEDLR